MAIIPQRNQNNRGNAEPPKIDAAKLIQILREVQMRDSVHNSKIREATQLYRKMNHKDFMKAFILEGMKHWICHDIGHEYADRGLRFLVKFAISVKSNDMNNENFPIFTSIVDYLVRITSLVLIERKRICNFMFLLLVSKMKENDQIDRNLAEKIIKNLRIYLKDAIPVRLQAIDAISQFQNDDDTVLEDLLYHLENDPSPIVRIAILNSIIVTDRTFPVIVKQTEHPNENVRYQALSFLNGQYFASLTVAERIAVLKRFANNSSERIETLFSTELLPSWLAYYDNNFLTFLSAIKWANTEEEVWEFHLIAKKILICLFRKTTIDVILQELPLRTSDRCVAFEHLTVELSVYWSAFLEFQNHGNDEIEDDETVQCDLETISRYIVDFIECIYINKSIDSTCDDEDMEKQFILLILIKMLNVFDFSEEYNRNVIVQFVKTILMSRMEMFSNRMIHELVSYIINLLPVYQIDSYFNDIFENVRNFMNPQSGIVERIASAITMIQNDDQRSNLIIMESEIKKLNKKKLQALNNQQYHEVIDIQAELTFWYQQIIGILKEYASSDDERAIDKLMPHISLEIIHKYFHTFFETIIAMPITTPIILLANFYEQCIQPLIRSTDLKIRCTALKCGIALAMRYHNTVDDIIAVCVEILQNEENVDLLCIAVDGSCELIVMHKILAPNGNGPRNVIQFLLQDLLLVEDHKLVKSLIKGLGKLILKGFINIPESIAMILIRFFNPNASNEERKALHLLFDIMNQTGLMGLLIDALRPAIKLIVTSSQETWMHNINVVDLVGFFIKFTKNVPNLQSKIAINIVQSMEENIHSNQLIKDLSNQLKLLKIEVNVDLYEIILPQLNHLQQDMDATINRNLNSFRRKNFSDNCSIHQSRTENGLNSRNTRVSASSVASSIRLDIELDSASIAPTRFESSADGNSKNITNRFTEKPQSTRQTIFRDRANILKTQ